MVLLILIELFFVILLADFVSGLVHWWEDAYIRQNTPLIGKTVGRNNIIHHYLPRYFTKYGWLYSAWDLLVINIIFIIIAYFLHILNWPILLFCFLTTNANQIHKWSHKTNKENGRIITFLQKYKIVISPRQHSIHHTNPKNTHYCPITNMLNPILHHINFWENLELIIYKIFRIKRKIDLSVIDKNIPDWIKELK